MASPAQQYRMHFIIAQLTDPQFQHNLSPDGRRFELLSGTSQIKVMSENRVFDLLGMTDFTDTDLFGLFSQAGTPFQDIQQHMEMANLIKQNVV